MIDGDNMAYGKPLEIDEEQFDPDHVTRLRALENVLIRGHGLNEAHVRSKNVATIFEDIAHKGWGVRVASAESFEHCEVAAGYSDGELYRFVSDTRGPSSSGSIKDGIDVNFYIRRLSDSLGYHVKTSDAATFISKPSVTLKHKAVERAVREPPVDTTPTEEHILS